MPLARSNREKFVQHRLLAAQQDARPVLLLNLNPFVEPFELFVHSLQGGIRTPQQYRQARHHQRGWRLEYVSLSRGPVPQRFHPDEDAELLADQMPPSGSREGLVVLDGCQGAGLRARTITRELIAKSLATGCQVVALASSADATEWLADLAEEPITLPSQYDATGSRLNRHWLEEREAATIIQSRLRTLMCLSDIFTHCYHGDKFGSGMGARRRHSTCQSGRRQRPESLSVRRVLCAFPSFAFFTVVVSACRDDMPAPTLRIRMKGETFTPFDLRAERRSRPDRTFNLMTIQYRQPRRCLELLPVCRTRLNLAELRE